MNILDPAHATLAVIDVQRAFDLWEAAGMRRNNPDAVTRIADLFAAFRAAHAPVLHIRHRSNRPGFSFAPDGAGYQVRDKAREVTDEPVVVREVNSAFVGTHLEARLRASGVRSVVICGAITNHCVETSTRMAGNLGFNTWLVRDATWTFDRTDPDGNEHTAEAIHAMTLSDLNGECAHIVSATEIVRALSVPAAAT